MEKLTEEQIKAGLGSDWALEGDAIVANYSFKDFHEAFSFMITVATAAESACVTSAPTGARSCRSIRTTC